MICHKCKNQTKVIDSRTSLDGLIVRRRRKCIKCNNRFTTYEKFDNNEKINNDIPEFVEVKIKISYDDIKKVINK